MKVRSWYGLTGELEVENQLWHLVKIQNLALNHPPLVNLILRRRLSEPDRLCLSYLHEYAHLQTLPLAIIHLLFLIKFRNRQTRSFKGWLVWFITMTLAHEAVWELLSEGYVVAQDPTVYRLVYHKSPNFLLPLFWVIMSSLGAGLSGYLMKRSSQSLSP
jgi:hypothetical protein